ncbi:MAG TPA: T9SS type A sorting domain-containing protein, partial [Puia sp.]|nr:T9SS type A sorting domain-containing protein [Puia sp.]
SSKYDFTDFDPPEGKDYYRIRQVDRDGRYSWSPILEFSMTSTIHGFHLQTNPVLAEIRLMNYDQVFIQRLQVMDISGRVLIDEAPASGNSLLKINSGSLRPGYYLMRIVGSGIGTTLGFVKL